MSLISLKDCLRCQKYSIFVIVVSFSFDQAVQETAKLEAENFTLRQQVNLAAEWKTVLDSWVRYEQQAKESEQAELVKAVVDKALKNLQDERTQREILANAIAEVERECLYLAFDSRLTMFY
jgi:Mitochondrial ATP synthase B chain precursor (ATP-synt_B)